METLVEYSLFGLMLLLPVLFGLVILTAIGVGGVELYGFVLRKFEEAVDRAVARRIGEPYTDRNRSQS